MLLSVALLGQAQQVTEDNFRRTTIHMKTPTLEVSEEAYGRLNIDGYVPGGQVGQPEFPVYTAMLAVPFCDSIRVEVSNMRFDTLTLRPGQRFYPLQPSRSKSDTACRFVVADSAYAVDGFVGLPRAEVTVVGTARDRRLARLHFSPVVLNPATGTIVVCREADIAVTYAGADPQRTVDHYRRYHTPAFNAAQTLNNPFAKESTANLPLRMVVVADQQLQCQALSRFAAWKNSRGIMTDVVYTTGSTTDTTAVASLLQGMFDTASAAYPAPTYVLLVGDVQQMPAFTSHLADYTYSYYGFPYTGDLSGHVTDLYYVTWTGNDRLPDAYIGRFSATDTATVATIVDKTLYYEQYAFDDDSYLARAVLVAGEDAGTANDNAYRCADPTMDYLSRYYINSSNGITDLHYYKNNTNFAPTGVVVTGKSNTTAAANALHTLYSEGVAWANYSAHGDWNEWHKPNLNVTFANTMGNVGKPSVMIGNCCLSARFDKPVCLAEALQRRGNRAGAVAYVGASQETYWDEDFYWSVGLRSSISNTMNTTYNSSKRGAYDWLFHSHNESFAQWATTMGAMLVAGNMAVNSNTSPTFPTMADYYWEIYHLFGDPSLIPWLGRLGNLPTPTVDNTGAVATVPYAYVALVDTLTGRVVSAAYANASGHASLDFPSATDHHALAVTVQGYRPFSMALTSGNVGIDGLQRSDLRVAPNPAADRVSVSAPGLSRVELLDMAGRRTTAVESRGTAVEIATASLPAGVYLLRVTAQGGSAVQKLVVAR